MMQFWIAMLVFIGSHMIGRTGLRGYIVRRAGEKVYISAYSSLSVALLSWLIYTAIQAPRIALWPWLHALYWIPNILMPLACVFLVSGFVIQNPLSIMPREKGFYPERPPMIVAVTRHPVLWGFFLWSASHIFPNGEFPVAFMFLIFALFSLAGIKMIDRKRQRIFGIEKWRNLSAHAPGIPFCGRALWHGCFSFGERDFAGVAGGLLIYAIFFYLHGIFFSVIPAPPPIPGF